MNNNDGIFENNTFRQDAGYEPNIMDCLCRLPIEEGVVLLVKKGVDTARSIKQSAKSTFQRIADDEYAKMCVPVLTLDKCIEWVKTQKMIYQQGSYFFIYIEKTATPRNANDIYSVAIALLDEAKKPIPVYAKSSIFTTKEKYDKNNQDIVCLVIPTGTIDGKLAKALNGTTSVLIKL